MQLTSVNLLAASRCCAPILRRRYPRANPIAEHHVETMSRTTNNDLSFATNVRRYNAGYEVRHRAVRITMREKFGLSNPWNSGFDRGGTNLSAASLTLEKSDRRLENRDLSAYSEFFVDGGGEGQVISSASTRGVAGLPIWWGLGLLSLMRTWESMPRAQGGGGGGNLREYPTLVPDVDITNRNEIWVAHNTRWTFFSVLAISVAHCVFLLWVPSSRRYNRPHGRAGVSRAFSKAPNVAVLSRFRQLSAGT